MHGQPAYPTTWGCADIPNPARNRRVWLPIYPAHYSTQETLLFFFFFSTESVPQIKCPDFLLVHCAKETQPGSVNEAAPKCRSMGAFPWCFMVEDRLLWGRRPWVFVCFHEYSEFNLRIHGSGVPVSANTSPAPAPLGVFRD